MTATETTFTILQELTGFTGLTLSLTIIPQCLRILTGTTTIRFHGV